MKTIASLNTLPKEQNIGSEVVIIRSDFASERLGWAVGIPIVTNKNGKVWEPDTAACYFWSIEGGGTIAARDEDGRLIEAYRLKEGESVGTRKKSGENNAGTIFGN